MTSTPSELLEGLLGLREVIRGNGWLHHIYLEHNVYNYLDFLIYIKNRDMNDCNGIEKYVKELMEAHKTDFLPIGRAMVLEKGGRRKEEETG